MPPSRTPLRALAALAASGAWAAAALGCGARTELDLGEAMACAPGETDRDGDCAIDRALGGDDCDDEDPSVHPGAPDNEGLGPWRFEAIARSEVHGGHDLALDRRGGLHAAYHGDALGYLRRRGPAWIEESPAGDATGWTPVLGVDGRGLVSLVFSRTSPGPRLLARREGGAWTVEPIELTRSTYRPALFVEEGGDLHLVYQEVMPASSRCGQEIVYAVRRGGRWEAELLVPSDPGCGVEAHIALDAAGRPHVSLNLGLGDLRYLTGPGFGTGGELRSVALDSSPMFVIQHDLALDPAGRPSVAWWSGDRGATSLASEGPSGFRTERVADAGRSSQPRLRIDAEGRRHLLLLDMSGEETILRYGQGGPPFAFETLAIPEGSASFVEPSLAVSPSGVAHLLTWSSTEALIYGTNWIGADGRDNNCDGVDGVDADGDGLASQATGGLDCDDTDPAIGDC